MHEVTFWVQVPGFPLMVTEEKELTFDTFEVKEGKLLGNGIEIDYIHRDGDGNIWVAYTRDGEQHKYLKHVPRKIFDTHWS